MQNIIKKLDENEYKCKYGTLIKNQFFIMPDCIIKNCIKIQIKENHFEKFKNKLKEINIKFDEKIKNNYYVIFELEKQKYIYIEFVVNSHVLVPKCLLNDFVSEDTHLYYIDTNKNKIIKSSKRSYNTIFGYYTKYFEDYLSQNYENKIGKIKKKIEQLEFEKKEQIQFVGLFEDVKSLLNMSFFRNPRFIKEINEESLSSKLTNGGYKSEDVAMFYNQFGTNILENYKIYLLSNRTSEGLVLSQEIFSNILIHEANQSMILPLHPKYALLLVPKEYYESRITKYGDDSYMIINNIDMLHKINNYIYEQCTKYKIDVIGNKEDLEKILISLK